jgi:hypothetical protein
MKLKVALGPFVTLEIEGSSCREISEALEGHEKLNLQLDEMCSNLAQRVYPEGTEDLGGETKESRE